MRATLERLSDGAVASHVSAAVLHGLPTWGMSLERVHVSRDRHRSGGRVGRRIHVHSVPLNADEVVAVGGTVVTSAARTVVDLARSIPVEQAVVVADAVLALGLADRAEPQDAVQRATRWRGSPAAHRVIAFADGRSESVGESRSRVAIRRADLPTPVPQWEVRAADGRLLGRVDFGWPDLATVGEFDGRVKYSRLLRPGQQPGDVVFAKKLREDELRSEGLGFRALDLGRPEPLRSGGRAAAPDIPNGHYIGRAHELTAVHTAGHVHGGHSVCTADLPECGVTKPALTAP